jgi:Na+/H+ antiporter NhaC
MIPPRDQLEIFGKRVAMALAAISLAMLVVYSIPTDRSVAQGLVAASLTRKALAALPLPTAPAVGSGTRLTPLVHLQITGPAELVDEVHRTAAAGRGYTTTSASARSEWGRLRIHCAANGQGMDLVASLSRASSEIHRWEGAQRWPTPWSILPPLIAIIFAIITRQVLGSMLFGAFIGALIYLLGDGRTSLALAVPAATWRTIAQYLVGVVTDSSSLHVLGFTFSLCGLVGLANRAGGNAGIVNAFSGLTSTPRRTRVATSLMGLAVFFDGYANAIVVGQTARPLTDAMRISREKLAYLVDSTAAPVAGLAIVSTWVGWEVGLFQSVAMEVGLQMRGYEMLIRALPFRFYCLFGLIFVALSTLLRRDFGPMLSAERRAFAGNGLWRPGSSPLTMGRAGAMQPPGGIYPRWWLTAAPVLLVLLLILVGTTWQGSAHPALATTPFEWSWHHIQLCFIHGDGGSVLFGSALLGSIFAALLARLPRRFAHVSPTQDNPGGSKTTGPPLLGLRDAWAAWFAGGRACAPALAILIAAKVLQASCDDLSTASLLVGLVAGGVPDWLLPLATFVVAATVAFGTGTSWGTMGILVPTVGPLAFHVGGPELMLIVLASILDGAVFGDHCSPISDTTIMASLSSQCDHIDHVRTQAPYALVAMTVAGIVGYLGVSAGLSSLQALVAGTAAIAGLLLLVGSDPERGPRDQTA